MTPSQSVQSYFSQLNSPPNKECENCFYSQDLSKLYIGQNFDSTLSFLVKSFDHSSFSLTPLFNFNFFFPSCFFLHSIKCPTTYQIDNSDSKFQHFDNKSNCENSRWQVLVDQSESRRDAEGLIYPMVGRGRVNHLCNPPNTTFRPWILFTTSSASNCPCCS